MKSIDLMLRRRGLLVAATVVASLGFASAASAATYTVNDTRDFPQKPTAPAGSCTSTAGTCTLRAAVMASNENGGSNTINLPAGTYLVNNSSSTTGSGYTECAGADESIKDLKVNDCNNSTQITIIGAGVGSTVLNANNANRVFTLYPNGSLDLQKMTVENGDGGTSGYGSNFNQAAPEFNSGDGGAVVTEGHLSAETVTFTGNTTGSAGTLGGGAISAEDESGSTASLTGDVFQNNIAGYGGAVFTNAPNDVTIAFSLLQSNTTTGDGGALEGDPDAAALTLNFDDLIQNATSGSGSDSGGGGLAWYGNGALNVSNSLFSQNQATGTGVGTGGGAILVDGQTSSNANISKTSFDGNAAGDRGGAVRDDDSNALTIAQAKFSGNHAVVGGALYLVTNNPASTGNTITSSEFDGNSAINLGGAIDWHQECCVSKHSFGVPLALLGDSFVQNTATNGGALDGNSPSLLTMEDTTMSRNTASSDGGAIYMEQPALLTMINDTIAFNNAGGGGGVFNPADFGSSGSAGGGFGVENTTIAENSGGDCSNGGGTSTFNAPQDTGNNDDSDQTCFGGLGGPNDKTGVNPLLANPANNGGPAAGGPGDTETVQTDAEQASSPTVNAGNNNGCPSIDERGVTRPQGSACDIGAFEFGANPTTATSTVTSTTNTTKTTSRTSTVTSTTTTHRPPPKHKKCKKGHHRSHGRCVKNKKHNKHHKKHTK